MKITELGGNEHNARVIKAYNCGWKKRSIFWDLPYWRTLSIRHNIDVMHVEKNVFENIFNTIMAIEGKTKDNSKARADIVIICRRPELEIDVVTRKYPKSCYSLDKKKKAKAQNPSRVPNEYLLDISFRPLRSVKSVPIYYVNGYKFHTLEYGVDRGVAIEVTQSTGKLTSDEDEKIESLLDGLNLGMDWFWYIMVVVVVVVPLTTEKCPDDKGVGDKAVGDKVVGFSQFASPKKCSGATSDGEDGFAKIVNKRKCVPSTGFGKEDGINRNSQGTKTTIEKAGYPNQARMRRFGNNVDNVPTQIGKGVPAHTGKSIEAQSGQCIPTKSRKQISSQYAQCAPTKTGHLSGHRVSSQSKERVHSQSGHRVSPKSGERIPDQIRKQGTSQLVHNSPTHSRQHRSQSGQTTPNESLQLTAQSRQHTPEPQSRPYTSGAQSEPVEQTPSPSHPSALNVSSTAANDNLYLNIGSQHKDGRIRVAVIQGTHSGGVDNRPSTHTSDSASRRTVAARLKIQFGRDPTTDELFYHTHTRRVKKQRNPIDVLEENGMDDEDADEEEVIWIDKKSQKIYWKARIHIHFQLQRKCIFTGHSKPDKAALAVTVVNFDKTKETFLELCEQQKNSGQLVDKNALFLQVVGRPDKKNRVYGLGSSQNIFYQPKTPCATSFATEEENQKLKQQLV
ncbi:hypothetical protein AgCh_039676 [Apium graveolens]